MIIAINYSDENFREAQKLNTMTAYSKGKVDKVIEYSPEDIEAEFYNKHKKIFSSSRGGGYWLWKPYIILKTMKDMNEGDYLLYCDSGTAYINNVQYLVDDLEKSQQDIMIFELPLIEKQWTKDKTFKLMECDIEEFRNSNQILATYILIKVNDNSKEIMSEFLELCTNDKILIDNYDKETDLIEHRHDQSIFSLLCKKKNLKTFRDPSQYGIRPWEYMANKRLYNFKKYTNSHYPQIFVSFRKENGKNYVRKDKIKYLLTILGILNKEQFIKKNNITL